MSLGSHFSPARLTGYIPDLPTPFDDHGNIDLPAFQRLCGRQISAGARALVVGGIAGEDSTLTPREHSSLVRTAVRTSRGRAAIIAGAGSNSTSQAITLTGLAEADGADAVLSVVPYYNKPTHQGIRAHFRAIADSTRLPIIVHDIPSHTGRELSDNVLIQLAASEQFVGLLDSTGDISRPLRLRSSLPREFRLLSGDDAIASAFLIYGGDGCFSITSNVVPHLCRIMYLNCGKQEGSANQLAIRLSQLTTALSQERTPAPLKYALSRLGLTSPNVRLPLVQLSFSAKAIIDKALIGCVRPDPRCE